MQFKERWQELQKIKIKFLQDNVDPGSYIYIDPEITASWIRSHAMGVSPYTEVIGEYVDADRLAEILKENRLLIDIAQSLFETLKIKDLTIVSNYALYLFDKNGILLMHEGDMLKVAPDEESLTGIVWNEKTMGTCAHILSMQLKRPVHLLGPEHYCITFNHSNTSAAPVLDESGDIIATLVLSQHLTTPPLDESFLNMSSHALGLITAMAVAVEDKLKLRKNYDQLETANERLKVAHHLLEVTLAVIDEGIITIDSTGKIVHLNKEGRRILSMGKHEIGNRNIGEFLSNQSQLMALIACRENADVEETICVDNAEQLYVINIRLVLNFSTKQIDGAVLKLINAEKVNALATSRAGVAASYNFEDLIGESKEFKKAVALGKRFASSPENVLLIGESGTGKELFAQAIHNKHRPYGPFMAVNCAALPRDLIESELFGYEGGSFTGAERGGRPGKIELAHGGTLFLDEIGDMPFELQAVLLRVLEDKQVMRVGGRRYKKVDFRVIAATNKDLYQMVNENFFRGDLYFRLTVLSINLPPLRQKGNDVEILSQYFIKKYCKKMDCKVPQISPCALRKIKEYNWPGNVRQLENAVIYAVNTAQSEVIGPEDLPAIVLGGGSVKIDAGGKLGEVYTLEVMERVVIENAMHKSKNNITKAAELLGIGKSTLYRKLKEYNIHVEE